MFTKIVVYVYNNDMKVLLIFLIINVNVCECVAVLSVKNNLLLNIIILRKLCSIAICYPNIYSVNIYKMFNDFSDYRKL